MKKEKKSFSAFLFHSACIKRRNVFITLLQFIPFLVFWCLLFYYLCSLFTCVCFYTFVCKKKSEIFYLQTSRIKAGLVLRLAIRPRIIIEALMNWSQNVHFQLQLKQARFKVSVSGKMWKFPSRVLIELNFNFRLKLHTFFRFYAFTLEKQKSFPFRCK